MSILAGVQKEQGIVAGAGSGAFWIDGGNNAILEDGAHS